MVENQIVVYENYTVYCHVNRVNGKKYFGITGKDKPNKRWRYGNGYYQNKHFYSAIQKYGWDGFDHIIIKTNLSQTDACNYEIALIAIYDTTDQDNGYNIAFGGNTGSSGLTRSLEARMATTGANNIHAVQVVCLNTLVEYECMTKAEDEYNLTRGAISKNCKDATKFAGYDNGIYLKWMYLEDYNNASQEIIQNRLSTPMLTTNSKMVICLNTGKVFNSQKEAAQYYNIKNPPGITKCCTRIRNTCGMYNGEQLQWMYFDDYCLLSKEAQDALLSMPKKKQNMSIPIPIICLNTMEYFKYAKSAARYTTNKYTGFKHAFRYDSTGLIKYSQHKLTNEDLYWMKYNEYVELLELEKNDLYNKYYTGHQLNVEGSENNMKLTIEQQYCTAFKRYGEKRSGEFNSIEIHSIGCAQNSAKPIRDNMNKYNPDGIVHAIVDAEVEGKVLEILPDYNVAWCDAGYGNSHSYAIEIAESDHMKYTGGANYTITNQKKFLDDLKRGYNTAVYYVAKKCKEFGFDPTKKLANGLYTVYSHKEANAKGLASGHVDPDHIFVKIGKTMDIFRSDVKNVMNGKDIDVSTTTADEPKWYRVRLAWNNPSSQTGAYVSKEKAIECCGAGYSVFDYEGKLVHKNNDAVVAAGLPSSKEDFINKVSEIAVRLYKETKILPSVVISQCCLETGYGLASDCKSLVEKNNLLGMKSELINSTWKDYTVWDGTSFWKKTPEVYNGVHVTITDAFRVYKNYEQCIRDYEMFLLNVQNNNGYKYRKVAGMTKPEDMLTVLLQGSYALDPQYKTSNLRVIKENNLTRFDEEAGVGKQSTTTTAPTPTTTTSTSSSDVYYVGTAWVSGKCQNQHNSFSIYTNAMKDADRAAQDNNTTYYVFDPLGKVKYTAKFVASTTAPVQTQSTTAGVTVPIFKPYSVKVSIPDLNIRKSPQGEKIGKYTGVGTFTIVDEKKIGSMTWGLLKAYEKNRDGWISLSYTKKI